MSERTVEHDENVQTILAMIDRVGTDGVLEATADAFRAKAAGYNGSDWLIDLAAQIQALN